MSSIGGIAQYKGIRYIITEDLMGTGLDHSFIVHSNELLCAIHFMIVCYVLFEIYT